MIDYMLFWVAKMFAEFVIVAGIGLAFAGFLFWATRGQKMRGESKGPKYEAELAALAEQCPKGQLLVPIGLLTEIRRAFEAEGEGRGHQHWDKTGQHGAGCPKCIAQCTAADLTRRALWNINNLLGPSSGEEGK